MMLNLIWIINVNKMVFYKTGLQLVIAYNSIIEIIFILLKIE